jgi:hypothetical protein
VIDSKVEQTFGTELLPNTSALSISARTQAFAMLKKPGTTQKNMEIKSNFIQLLDISRTLYEFYGIKGDFFDSVNLFQEQVIPIEREFYLEISNVRSKNGDAHVRFVFNTITGWR